MSTTATSFATSDFQDLPATVSWPLDAPLDIVLPDVDVGRLSPCMLVQTADQGVLGLVQMCGWDAISPQWQPAGNGANLPVLIWNSTGTIPPMPESLGGIGGTVQWTVSGTDQYVAADVDGDGVQEIVAAQNGMLGVFKWAGSALYVLWSDSCASGTGGAASWTPQQGDGYLPACLGAGYTGGQDALFAWNPNGMAVLGWSGSALQSIWSGTQIAGAGGGASWVILPGDASLATDMVGQGVQSIVLSRSDAMGVAQWDAATNALSLVWSTALNLWSADDTQSWPLQANDQHAAAPLQVGESVYQESLVLFNPTTLMAGLAQWDPDSAQLQLLWIASNTIPQDAGGVAIPLDGSTVLMAAALQADVPMVLFAQSGSIGCVLWDGEQLAGQWLQQGSSYPGIGGASAWQCSSDQYTVVAGPAGGQQQLLAQATGGSSYYGLLVFDGDNAVNCCWQGSQGMLPGWGLPLIAAAPQTGYPPFAPGSVEEQMYTTLSNQLLGWQQGGDLRSQYTTTNLVQQVQAWISQIQAMDMPPVPPPANPPWQWPLDLSLWNAVRQTLLNELQNLAAVYGLYGNLITLAAAIGTQMDADLSHVITEVAPPSSGAPQVSFSLPNLVASIPAACPALSTQNPALGTGLALLVPLLPSVLLQDQPSSQQMDYGNVQSVVDAAFGNVSQYKLNVLGQNQIAGDFVKAGMVATLAQQGWAWPAPSSSTDNVAADMAAATQDGNRVQFYATVIPAAYTIYYEQTSFSHLRGDRWMKTPSYAAWTTSISGEPWCYTIATGDNMEMDFPSQDMMSDVLSLAQPADFYLGNGPWAALVRVSW
ncbi:MAG: hypothetical protein V4864_24185 [Pseudomonadota bacterium]